MKSYIDKFTIIYKEDENSRYRSYDHCRKAFIENKNNKDKYDLITLNLYAYLASWGMLRNSFLLQKDYLFNKPVVDILCKEEYSRLINFNPLKPDASEDLKLIMKLGNEIKKYYKGKTYITGKYNSEETIKNVSDTLVTKIILGTFGCVLAYDNYVKRALRQKDINGCFSVKSMEQIVTFAKKHKDEINEACNELGNLYTPMKILDMYFWEVGRDQKS